MAMTSVNPVEEKQKEPSALENAAKVLGIATSVGSLGVNAYSAANPTQTANPLMMGSQKPGFQFQDLNRKF